MHRCRVLRGSCIGAGTIFRALSSEIWCCCQSRQKVAALPMGLGGGPMPPQRFSRACRAAELHSNGFRVEIRDCPGRNGLKRIVWIVGS